MPPLVDTVIEDSRWQEFGLDGVAEAAGAQLLASLDLPVAGFSVVVLGCDDARIAELNAGFRSKAGPTNVLSWPSQERGATAPGLPPAPPLPGSDESPEELGDLALAWETCAREAEAQGKPMNDHVAHLIVHGILHLLGYDHEDDADAALMEGIERHTLARMGIADPYC